jgi:hypothetical protein
VRKKKYHFWSKKNKKVRNTHTVRLPPVASSGNGGKCSINGLQGVQGVFPGSFGQDPAGPRVRTRSSLISQVIFPGSF